MRNRIFSLLILAAFCLNLAPDARAQVSASDWSNLQKVALGTFLIIEPKTGKAIKASLEGVGGAEIVVYGNKKFLTLDKDSIARIYLSRTGSEKDAKEAGASIGMLAGLVAMAVFVPGGSLLLLAGGGTGALIGKESAKKKRRGRLIYEAQ